ncbi:MAG: NADP-dependent isocitrate dehydrogenase [Proteobacteria bacterium]|nr:NADP-dependent isocitrate dehydrogenase [Pseudomonadota bacterium]
MTEAASSIIYTHTDEAPALATYSFLPIVRAFAGACGVSVEIRDISLAGRLVAGFPDELTQAQRIPDALAELGELTHKPHANIIKLPNISASIPQLKAAIKELQAKGYRLPDYPDDPTTEDGRAIKARYDRIKGSAVNPVLREGNSDRRAPKAVKAYARNHPHPMGAWSPDSKTHVAHMSSGDFRSNEQSVSVARDGFVRIELSGEDGQVTVLKDKIDLTAGEILDATFLSVRELRSFLEREMQDAQQQGVLFSLHMKATMMKVSDPIIFGHCVKVFFKDVFARHGAALGEAGGNPNDGLGNVLAALGRLDESKRAQIEADLQAAYTKRPGLAMVDSDRGITNLHVPSDIIIDASMPAMIRASGRMWNRDGRQQDTKCVIPDASYAGVYQQVISFCKEHGAFDPSTMGSVSNVGLMAQKAEEYGSHDKTFEIPSPGMVRVIDQSGTALTEHKVEAGDIWRACQVKDAAVRDWVKLAVARTRATGASAVFWLDETRPHDAQLIEKVRGYLPEHDTQGLAISILSPVEATRFTLERLKAGQDTVSVTGNVLRDYLTDLFPILELGTSAKMLSIVPLMQGGGLYETGAGGSAPKHVQQFNKENHLRWDSLGEFLALAASLEQYAAQTQNRRARLLGSALDVATEALLEQGKSPSRKVRELDNRGSQFYLAMYWAQALAKQSDDPELAARFAPLAEALSQNEAQIVGELNAVQGEPKDVGGYYAPDPKLASEAMRPSTTLNGLIDSF